MSPRKLIFIIVSLLILLFWRFFTFYQTIPMYQNGQEISLQVVLQETPEISARGQRFVVKTAQNQRIAIQSSLSEHYHYGDVLAITGKLQVKNNEKGYAFLTLYYPQIRIVDEAKNPLIEASGWVREKSTALFVSTLPPISASLLLGILFGANEQFPADFRDALRTTGVLHVIAASGMNVAFFTGAVMFSLGKIFHRRISLLLSVFVVIFYSFLVGFQASIIRASLMALVAITASFFGRQTLALFGLFMTGYAMLLWQPAFLFDVGFQLSFMATLGILVIGERLVSLGKIQWVGEDFKTTLSAQIATLPILLGTFGSVGVLSVVVNILVLWTVPVIMVVGSLGVLGGLVFAPLGKMFLFLSLPFLLFFEYVVAFFGSFNFTVLMEEFPWQLAVGYYLVIGAIVFSKRKQEEKTLR